MIDEAIGKILGMLLAYLVSALGLLLAYINYRKRIVKAERVMTPVAWGVIAVTLLAVVAGAAVVTRLAAAAPEAAALESPAEAPPPVTVPVEPPAEIRERSRWPLVGILVPAIVFLFATLVTAGLHRHFSKEHPSRRTAAPPRESS